MFVPFVSTLAIAALATAKAADRVTSGPVGVGYSSTAITPELTTLLYTSLANETLYANGIDARICITAVSLIERQVISGANYRFTATACDVPKTLQRSPVAQKPTAATVSKCLGQCEASFTYTCVPLDAIVTVHESGDNSVQVSSIVVKDKSLSPGQSGN